MTDRLTKAAWIKHGLTVLADHGIDAIRVLPLARSLNVSRGSFYWHFGDLEDYRSDLLKTWQKIATDRIIRDLAKHADKHRLKLLLTRAFVAERGLEQAVRAWASQDEKVASIVATIDAQRVDYIAQLLEKAGLSSKLAQGRATFIYWAYLGQGAVLSDKHKAVDEGMIRNISSLLEN